MSSDERSTSKRQHEEEQEGESDCEEQVKRAKVEEEEEEENDEKIPILDAIKTIDRIQYELNMAPIFMDSPESSDHDTPPESEDESEHSEGALSQAHALGYACCIRETFRFLESCGIPENDPIYRKLKSRFV